MGYKAALVAQHLTRVDHPVGAPQAYAKSRDGASVSRSRRSSFGSLNGVLGPNWFLVGPRNAALHSSEPAVRCNCVLSHRAEVRSADKADLADLGLIDRS